MDSQDLNVRNFLGLLRSFLESLEKTESQELFEILRLERRVGEISNGDSPKAYLAADFGQLAGRIASLQLPAAQHGNQQRLAAYAARLAQNRPTELEEDSFDTLAFKGYGIELHKEGLRVFVIFDMVDASGEFTRKYQAELSQEEALQIQKSASDASAVLELHSGDAKPYGR